MFRGEDVTDFLPAPDFILMADCIYYEEVNCIPLINISGLRIELRAGKESLAL